MSMRLLSPEQRAELQARSTATASAATSLPDEYLAIAYDLCKIHGSVRWAKEAHGVHLYLASPECLDQYGAIELSKMHLAVNIQKHFEKRRDKVAMCMKTGKHYRVSELLKMPPLEARGIVCHARVVREDTTNQEFLEDDGAGNMVPKSPGMVIPVTLLAEESPAITYLRARQFDPAALYTQFRLSYGIKEREDMHRFYKRMSGGFRATPQGRLIFFIDVDGICRGWQSRILEMDAPSDEALGRFTFYFHPYRQAWTAVKHWDETVQRWKPLAGYEDWDPVKYALSHGARRNQLVMGFDAAVNAAMVDGRGRRYCFLVEGPLDAGRLGVPALAHLGKFLSPDQADLIASRFQRVIYVRDNDAAGESAVQYVSSAFSEHSDVQVEFHQPPAEFKDVGEMSPEQAGNFKETLIWTVK